MGQVIKGWTEAMQLMVEGARGFDKTGLAALREIFVGYNPYMIHGTNGIFNYIWLIYRVNLHLVDLTTFGWFGLQPYLLDTLLKTITYALTFESMIFCFHPFPKMGYVSSLEGTTLQLEEEKYGNMKVSRFGISNSFSCHVQLNHLQLMEGYQMVPGTRVVWRKSFINFQQVPQPNGDATYDDIWWWWWKKAIRGPFLCRKWTISADRQRLTQRLQRNHKQHIANLLTGKLLTTFRFSPWHSLMSIRLPEATSGRCTFHPNWAMEILALVSSCPAWLFQEVFVLDGLKRIHDISTWCWRGSSIVPLQVEVGQFFSGWTGIMNMVSRVNFNCGFWHERCRNTIPIASMYGIFTYIWLIFIW